MDSIEPEIIGSRYVVGIDRELAILGYTTDEYIDKIMGPIRASDLTEPLKSHVLSQIDVVELRELTVIRIRVPAQKDVSFVGDKAFIREGSSTIEVAGPKLMAIIKLFQQ